MHNQTASYGWQVYLATAVDPLFNTFQWPAFSAATTLLVPRKHLGRAGGMVQIGEAISQLVAPALFAIVPLFFVYIPQPRRPKTPEEAMPSVLADFREGLRFVWGWPGLMMILVMATVLNMLAYPAMSLKPIMVTEHFKGGASALAGLESAIGIGMVIGGITLSVWGGFKRRIVTAMVTATLQGVGFTLVGLAPATAFGLAMAAFFFIGVMNPIVNGSLMAVLQAAVPPGM